MNLLELHNTRLDLEWEDVGDEHRTTFVLDDRRYGITLRQELSPGELSFIRVDFYAIDDEGRFSLEATNVHEHAFKVLGVVVNAVRERFPTADGYYFVVKKRLYPDEYERRLRIYGRMAHKLHIENSMVTNRWQLNDETVFALTRDAAGTTELKTLLGETA